MLFGIPDTEKDLVWCTLDYRKDKTAATHVLLPCCRCSCLQREQVSFMKESHTVGPVTHCSCTLFGARAISKGTSTTAHRMTLLSTTK